MPKASSPVHPENVSTIVQAYLNHMAGLVTPDGSASRCGQRFSWCGEVFDFLTRGVEEHVASRGLTFQGAYPGPLVLWDEEQQPDGEHARRFWAVAYDRSSGRPVARVCTVFFHRHDRVALPRPPLVLAFPTREDEAGGARP